MTTFPALFVSHGAPDLLLHSSPARAFLQQLGTQLGTPNAILVVSAHWLTRVPTVSTASQMTTIHDFGGFPKALYELKYTPPGAPHVAERTGKLLTQAGFEAAFQPNRGLDHGAWEPLMLMYPDANIPVTQLSIQPTLGTSYHLQLGRALASLRQEGVLILASGAATHNPRTFGQYALDATHRLGRRRLMAGWQPRSRTTTRTPYSITASRHPMPCRIIRARSICCHCSSR